MMPRRNFQKILWCDMVELNPNKVEDDKIQIIFVSVPNGFSFFKDIIRCKNSKIQEWI